MYLSNHWKGVLKERQEHVVTLHKQMVALEAELRAQVGSVELVDPSSSWAQLRVSMLPAPKLVLS